MDRYIKTWRGTTRLGSMALAALLALAAICVRAPATPGATGSRISTKSALALVGRFRCLPWPPNRDSRPASRTSTTVDKAMFRKFAKAWAYSVDGHSVHEGVVLIFRATDGTYIARLQHFTNQYKEVSFTWDAAAIAIVHTHPDSCDPQPSEQDKRVADQYGVPNFTITSSGMYVYDPATRKTSKVFDRLDWLKPANLSRWTQELARHVDHASHTAP